MDHGGGSRQRDWLERRGGQCRGEAYAEILKKTDNVRRPTHGYRGSADGVLQHKVPPDNPSNKLAHGGVRVSVGTSRDRDHGGELAITDTRECAANSGKHK